MTSAAVTRTARRTLARGAVRIDSGRIRLWRLERGRERWAPADAVGRWNDAGVALIYASTTAALAALEGLAHLDRGEGRRVHRLASLEVDVEADEVAWLPVAALPTQWKRNKPLTRAIGAAFAATPTALALLVPVALAPGEQNVLINPRHHGWARWRSASVELPFHFDGRLVDAIR